MRRNQPRPALEPPTTLRAQAPESGHLRALGPCTSSFCSGCSAHCPARGFPSQVSRLPPGERRGQAGRAQGPAPAGRASPTQPRTQTLRVALTGRDCSTASAFLWGSMALPDPRVRSLRHTAPPRKWTPAARLWRPGPPPAQAGGRGPAGRRSVRPSVHGPGRQDTAAPRMRPREGSGARMGTHDGRAGPLTLPGCDGGRGTHDGPARPQAPPRGQLPPASPSRVRTRFRTCQKDDPVRGLTATQPSHYQSNAWVRRRVSGFRIQIPDSIQTLHISERRETESRAQF